MNDNENFVCRRKRRISPNSDDAEIFVLRPTDTPAILVGQLDIQRKQEENIEMHLVRGQLSPIQEECSIVLQVTGISEHSDPKKKLSCGSDVNRVEYLLLEPTNRFDDIIVEDLDI